MTLRQFGQRLWGIGVGDAESRLTSIKRDELLQMGLNRELAQWWHQFYLTEARRGRGLPASIQRARLLEKCIELLS
jgi:hypothetical protein